MIETEHRELLACPRLISFAECFQLIGFIIVITVVFHEKRARLEKCFVLHNVVVQGEIGAVAERKLGEARYHAGFNVAKLFTEERLNANRHWISQMKQIIYLSTAGRFDLIEREKFFW